MKAKGMVEVARALIASAKSRWVPQRLWLQYLTGCQMRIVRLWLDPRWEAISRSGAEVGRGKQGGGGTQEGLKEVRDRQFCQLHLRKANWCNCTKKLGERSQILSIANCTWERPIANCSNCERGQLHQKNLVCKVSLCWFLQQESSMLPLSSTLRK